MRIDAKSRFVIALTGGVAAGKNEVARRFEVCGVRVYDADDAARAVVAPGEPALTEIEFVFGAGILHADGTLDRRGLRERIFADARARGKLEAIVHPRVREWLRRRVATDRGPYCILAIPLLAETWPAYAFVDRVLLVDAPDALRIERLMRRDDITLAQAQRTLAAQATREQRLALAQDVIVNDGDPAHLDAEITALHARYLELAKGKSARSERSV
ncbi:MAG TPA: dephospho-CoA kinase [Rhodanobacteraceae bacterium]|nr:dephospho-CoA kinase [Rhodanobacteraceae bacterium]